jgi:hypothetical protein
LLTPDRLNGERNDAATLPLGSWWMHPVLPPTHGKEIRSAQPVLAASQWPPRSYRQWQCLWVIVKIPNWSWNPDFPALKGLILICLRASGSFQRNMLSPRWAGISS